MQSKRIPQHRFFELCAIENESPVIQYSQFCKITKFVLIANFEAFPSMSHRSFCLLFVSWLLSLLSVLYFESGK